MLSFLARMQVNYQLPGACPEPPPSTILFGDNPPRLTIYHTAMYYESESHGGHIFGTSRAEDELNCLRVTFKNVTESLMDLEDCGYYEGHMTSPDMVNSTSYNITLVNTDITSQCRNQTTQIANISVWADPKREFLIMWSCSENFKKTTHKQVVVVFVNSDVNSPDASKEASRQTLSRVIKFAEDTLWFSRVNVSAEFLVNKRLMVDLDPACNIYNCSANCADGGVSEGMSGGPIIFFIAILLVVILIFVVVL